MCGNEAICLFRYDMQPAGYLPRGKPAIFAAAGALIDQPLLPMSRHCLEPSLTV